MVLGSSRQKPKPKTIQKVLAWASSKMALESPQRAGSQRSRRMKQLPHRDLGESDCDILASPLPLQAANIQPDLLHQFECMLYLPKLQSTSLKKSRSLVTIHLNFNKELTAWNSV